MVDRKVVPFDEFYYQLKLMYLFLLHVVYQKELRKVNMEVNIEKSKTMIIFPKESNN
jgi:hypothetical protein